jgi:hypothetical protein
LRPASDSPSLSCALAYPPAFATLSFVSSSADAKPLLSDDMTSKLPQVINVYHTPYSADALHDIVLNRGFKNKKRSRMAVLHSPVH